MRTTSKKESSPITRKLALFGAALLVGGAFVTPVGANMLRGGISSFSMTDPGILALIGAAMISVGVWTRRVLFGRGGR
jgi:hypothetical protein